MNAWMLATIVVTIGGLGPALWLASRGTAVERLIGLQLGSVSTIVMLMLFSQAQQQSAYLIVPLVLAVLSFIGTLVYTRLLGPRP